MAYKTPLPLKISLLLLLLLLFLSQTAPLQAQSTTPTLESLVVDIWPDYDRPSVLVLLTGVVPAGVSLPATVSVPVPDNADVTAVARIADDGTLFSDITFDESPGEVTLTTPDFRFRIEYYMPYDLDGEERTFTFEWQAGISVNEMLLSVQQPVATAEMTTNPAAFSVTPRQDGFTYYNLSPREVPAGEPISLEVSYSRAVGQLSAELLQPEQTSDTTGSTATTDNQPTTPANTQFGWPVILLISGGVAVLAIGTWMVISRGRQPVRQVPVRSRPAPKKERVRRPEPVYETEADTAAGDAPSPTFARFCHQCGQKSDPEDVFCRSCGTKLKT